MDDRTSKSSLSAMLVTAPEPSDDWLIHSTPKLFQVFAVIIRLPRFYGVCSLFYSSLFVLAVGIVIYNVSTGGVVIGSTLYAVYMLLALCVACLAPIWMVAVILKIINSPDVHVLISDVHRYDDSVPYRFRVIAHMNFVFFTIGVIVCISLSRLSIYAKVIFGIMALPTVWIVLCTFIVLLYILEAHRLQVCHFMERLNRGLASAVHCPELRGELLVSPSTHHATELPFNLASIWDDYYNIQNAIHLTSRQHGLHMFGVLSFLCMFIIASVSSIYEHVQVPYAAIGNLVYCVSALVELGLWIATVNELASKGIAPVVSRVVLFFRRPSGARRGSLGEGADMHLQTEYAMLLLECVCSSNPRVCFWGTAALENKMLVAVVGSTIAAVIPRLLQ